MPSRLDETEPSGGGQEPEALVKGKSGHCGSRSLECGAWMIAAADGASRGQRQISKSEMSRFIERVEIKNDRNGFH